MAFVAILAALYLIGSFLLYGAIGILQNMEAQDARALAKARKYLYHVRRKAETRSQHQPMQDNTP